MLGWFLVISFLCYLPPVSPVDSGWFGTWKGNTDKWSSLMTVDPSNMIALMVEHGGLILPESTRQDVDVVKQVCHTGSVKLNVLKRQLVVEDFRVRPPGEDTDAVHIQSVIMEWDSYLKPCVSVKVDNVTISLEFYNLLLTKSNWYVLHVFRRLSME